MWKIAMKLVALFALRKGLNLANSDFHHIKSNIADLTESRAAFFMQNFNSEIQRIVRSLVGLMLALAVIVCASISAIIWAVAAAWSSPNRDIILGATTLILAVIGAVIFVAIYLSWNAQPLFNQSMKLIEQDWRLLRNTNNTDRPND